MGAKRKPTARQMRLATELRRLREAAGLSARETAAQLGVNSVQISQIELGTTGVSEQRLRRMATIYGCADNDLIDALVSMATDRTSGWWEADRGLVDTEFLDLAELEDRARYRWDMEILHIPGLLQTEAYAHALFSYINPTFSEDVVEHWVQHRMKRRTIIERAAPTPYEAIIHEAALRIRVSDRPTARFQLTRILELAEAAHITVRVIPFDLDGFGGAGSAMSYAGGPVPQLDTVVRDTPYKAGFIDDEEQLKHFRTLFRRLQDASLDPRQSQDFIHTLAKEL
ncbi:helix-turn-helix transcriptional regulator [Streptomyces sp. NPDC093252]|uniref:helix-turn-helix domain-containing protein n=1 Tax=Streptomyces sp. NPDC093252 TaxID=3154980 RepID=UPI0034346AD8